jgi:hypothetical protein
MTATIKTIKRRKGWPKWARWYAVDPHGCGVYDTKPEIGEACGGLPSWIFGGRGVVVSGPSTLTLRCHWTQTLRRIVP